MEPKVNQLEYAKGLLQSIERHAHEGLTGDPKLISARFDFIADFAISAIYAIEKHQGENQ